MRITASLLLFRIKVQPPDLVSKKLESDRRMFNALEASSSTPSVVLLLTLRASRLRDKDVFSKSDPMCVVSQFVGRLTGNGQWKECGRTERLQNTLNPEWATQIRIEYFFEEKQTMKFEVGLKGNCGEITIWSEEVDEGSKENVLFNLSARKLDKKDFFGKSDPFLNIYRVNDDGSRLLVHRTEAIMRELNPTWKPFEVNVKMLCFGDRSRDSIRARN
ncbi:C2 domain protein [Ancylostoma ceylanicum]|uniref:C2 domain protein n=1 Tax=Ancylostoma ceylanicum TaxID=53326 RepID=A0A0D6LM85_9BILA|nr:C2 domain protein [Ancylostoma ceylanicum]